MKLYTKDCKDKRNTTRIIQSSQSSFRSKWTIQTIHVNFVLFLVCLFFCDWIILIIKLPRQSAVISCMNPYSTLSYIYTRAKVRAIFFFDLCRCCCHCSIKTQTENNATDWKRCHFRFRFYSSINASLHLIKNRKYVLKKKLRFLCHVQLICFDGTVVCNWANCLYLLGKRLNYLSMETIIRFSTAAMLHRLPMKPVISQKPWEKGHSSFNRAAAKEKVVSRKNISDSNCFPVADPGFPRRGTSTLEWGPNLL